jgi:hypothetical protein
MSYQYFWNTQTGTWADVNITYLNSSYAHTAEFNMTSGTPDDHLDYWNTNTDTWDSLTSQQEAWGRVPNIAVPRTATFTQNSGMSVPTVGFALAGVAEFAMASTLAERGNSTYPVEITLASTEGASGLGNQVFVDSITFANTVNIPLAGTTTWDLDTSTWASATTYWGYAPPVKLNVTAEITQVMLNKLNAEDIQKIASALMPTEMGVGATVTLVMPFSGTLESEQDMKFNINFEESATLSATSGTSSSSNFLWNDIAEDTGSTWTKVSDPDE